MPRTWAWRFFTAEIGPLAGYEVQFVGNTIWVRGWVLESNGIPLDITYRSDVSLRGRDDAEDVCRIVVDPRFSCRLVVFFDWHKSD